MSGWTIRTAVTTTAACSGRRFRLLLLPVLLSACTAEEQVPAAATDAADNPPASEVADRMLQAMGGREALQAVRSMVSTGSGIRNHLGQIPVTGGEDPQAQLDHLTEVIDFANGRAGWDNEVVVGEGFGQHRTEAYTRYQGQPLGWGTTEGRPDIVTSVNGLFSWSTHNSPEFLLRRNPVSVALAALGAGSAPVGEQVVEGEARWTLPVTLGEEELTLLIDQQEYLLDGFTAIDTETMRGDQQARYLYSDWHVLGAGLKLPFNVEIRHGDGLFARIQYDDITLNDESALALLEVPEDAHDQAAQVLAMNGESWVPLEWNEVAGGVIHAVAFSHHSMVVEFPGFVVVVEGPYTEAQSLTLARMIEEKIGKPIRYVVPTHPHYDHTGGLRGFASTGALVLTAAGHEDEIRMIIESPHTNPPDALARNLNDGAEVGRVEVFTDRTDITEDDRQLRLYEVETIPHVNPKVLAYVPDSKVLFQSDLFFGGPGPDAEALYQAIIGLDLEVEQIVGGHGGVLPFTALEQAVTGN